MTSTLPPTNDVASTNDVLSASLFDTSGFVTTPRRTAHVPEGCYTAFSDLGPLDSPTDLISEGTVEVFEIVIYCGLMPMLCIVGLVTNPCCCAVFYRLGVKKGINLCLLLLSISDTLFLVTQTMVRSSKVLLALLYGRQGTSRWDYTMVTYHFVRKGAVFLFFSNFLTTLASVERCISIISPLKARLMFTPSKMVAITVVVFVVDLIILQIIGFNYKVTCVFNMDQNTSVWAMTTSELRDENKLAFNILDNLVLIFGFPMLSVTVVVVSTSLLLHGLRRAARWRQHTSCVGGRYGFRDSMLVNKSETQLHKMLVAVACVYVICTMPSILKDVSKFFVPSLNTSGNYSNLFNVIIAIKDAMASINCIINFFIYYRLSAQFRKTLTICLGRHTNGTELNVFSISPTALN